jgi:hypothetical protein
MSPTNLGDLPTGQPIPNGAVQVKRGIVDSYTNYTSGTAVPTTFPDGAGGLMQISVTPSMPCYWLTTAAMLWWCSAAAWYRADFGMRLSPSDLDGRNAQMRVAVAVHSSVPWRYYNGSMMWRLSAGITYTCSMTFEYAVNTAQFSTSPSWHALFGLLLAEGAA